MKTLAYISAAFALFPAITGLIRFRMCPRPFKLIAVYFLVALMAEIAASTMAYYGMNNNLLGDIFYIVEGLFLISFFYLFYAEEEFLYPAIIIAIAYLLYGVYTTVVDPGPWLYNPVFRTAESLLVQALAAYALIRISKEEGIEPSKHPGFWIATGFFIYFSVNMTVFITATVLFADNIPLMKSTWFIHSCSNILVNLLFAYGLFCIPLKIR
ncbi:MAG: hypothetical protein IPP71_06970 [Bacteroidetes bacterium]|nr:hypothetical protein [Bacteroidota bacterium]